MAEIALTACAKLEDYRQAIIHAGGEVRVDLESRSLRRVASIVPQGRDRKSVV